MPVLQEKQITITFPRLDWKYLLNLRFLILFSVLVFTAGFAYWYQMVRPFLWLSSAHIEAVSTIVSSHATGRIVEMGAQEGDRVKKGDTLFIFDEQNALPRQIRVKQKIQTLRETIEKEKERMGQAMSEYLAATNEIERGVGAAERVKRQLEIMDEAQINSDKAQEELTSAGLELAILEQEIKKITAPFDGVILKKVKNEGAVVSFGDPIYVLCDTNHLWIETQISESQICKIQNGTSARVQFPAYPHFECTGQVSYIGSATVSKSEPFPLSIQPVAIPIKISIVNPPLALKPGLSARVGLKIH